MSRRNAGRGVALLLVLATLVMAVTSAVVVARCATHARLGRDAAAEDLIADSLLRSAEAPILDWLHRHSARLVLPAESTSPRFLVLRDQITIGHHATELTITAFDQCGMRSWVSIAKGQNVGAPAEMAVMLRGQTPARSPPGLDLLATLLDPDAKAFPRAVPNQKLAAGELLATHNPPRSGGTPLINVNTAPMSLIAVAYAARSESGVEAVAAARAAGRTASPGALAAPREASGDRDPLPVAMSTAWAFRVDCRVGQGRRSWWCVYVDTGSNWERMQLLGIDE